MEMPKTFFSWLDFWLDFYHKPKVTQDTYQCTFQYIKIIRKLSSDIELNAVDEFHCQMILNKMFEEDYSKGTIKKIVTILRQSFMRARRNQLMTLNPTEFLIIPKAKTKIVEALSIEEQVKIEEACTENTLGHLILFMLNTGLRRSELINLKWSDFDKKEREIMVRKSKTPSGIRAIPLVKVGYQIITSQPKSEADNYIFHGHKGTMLSDSIMKKTYEQIRKATGINTFTNHVCRHTFATRLIEVGANPKSVATLLGHAKVECALNIYTNIEKKHIRKEIFLLEQ